MRDDVAATCSIVPNRHAPNKEASFWSFCRLFCSFSRLWCRLVLIAGWDASWAPHRLVRLCYDRSAEDEGMTRIRQLRKATGDIDKVRAEDRKPNPDDDVLLLLLYVVVIIQNAFAGTRTTLLVSQIRVIPCARRLSLLVGNPQTSFWLAGATPPTQTQRHAGPIPTDAKPVPAMLQERNAG